MAGGRKWSGPTSFSEWQPTVRACFDLAASGYMPAFGALEELAAGPEEHCQSITLKRAAADALFWLRHRKTNEG